MTVKKLKNLSLCSCSSISFLVVLTLDFSHKIPGVDFFFGWTSVLWLSKACIFDGPRAHFSILEKNYKYRTFSPLENSDVSSSCCFCRH